MAIVRMISRDLAEFRAFQTRSTEIGRIRIGQFTVPEGKKGRPVKLDRFRLTSTTEDHIRVAAAEYGGEARPYSPQGGGQQQWEVITEAAALDVWIVNRQLIDPVYEMWGAGRTCTRRCDGEWNTVLQEPCLCNDPERRPADPRQLCKITTRVNVMLPKVAGLHSWRLETHSENAAVEMAAPAVAGLVRAAQVPVPATLRLRKEMRRERNHAEGKFETKDFFVPWFDLSRIGAQALAGGEETLRVALTGAGAPELLADQRAIGVAPPMSAPPALTQGPQAPHAAPVPPPVAETLQPAGLSDGELARILVAIEKADTPEALTKLGEAFKARDVRHKDVYAAFRSKRAAVEAAEQLAREAELRHEYSPDPWAEEPVVFEDAEREYAVGDTVTVAGIEFTISDDPFPPSDDSPLAGAARGDDPRVAALAGGRDFFSDDLPGYDEAIRRGATHAGIVAAGGPTHWLAGDDQARVWVEPDGVEDGPGAGLPMVATGTAGPVAVELSALMAAAGQRVPPWTTDMVRAATVAAFNLGHVGEASGEQFLRVRLALEQGLLDA